MATCFIICVYQRLQKKYDTAPDQFASLQSIVESEIAEGTNIQSKSCTLGLLWLKRYASVYVCVYVEYECTVVTTQILLS